MTTCRVGSPPYTLVLAQVVPGYDGDVAQALAAQFSKGDEARSEIRDHIYFAFSEYDVLAILPLGDTGSLGRLTTFGHEYVRDLQQVLCFPWWTGAREHPFEPGPALTVTFLKLDESLVAAEGIEADYDAVHWLRRRIGEIRKRQEYKDCGLKACVLGTLGWPELLLMLTGNDLGLLLNIVRDLPVGPIERPNRPPLRFAFSHTLPCVRWKGGANFSAEHVSGDLYCEVMVNVSPDLMDPAMGHIRALLEEARRSADDDAAQANPPAWDARVVFGRRDLIIAPHDGQPVSVENITKLLSLLRSKGPEYEQNSEDHPEPVRQVLPITSTHTHISVPLPNLDSVHAVNPTRLQRLAEGVLGPIQRIWTHLEALPPFRFWHEPPHGEGQEELPPRKALDRVLRSIRGFEEWERHLGNPGLAHAGRLRQMLFRYQAVQCTPELQGVVDDMTDVLAESIAYAAIVAHSIPLPPMPLVTQEIRAEYDEFEEIANLFFYGLDQRLAGAVFGVSDPARAYTHLHALGIQRILRAVEAVPRALLRLLWTQDGPLHWPGFVLFGYGNETAKLAFNVLNMPYQDVATPSQWWRLGHEAGHAAVDLLSLPDLPGFLAVQRRLEQCEMKDLARDPAHLLDELAANVFEFEFAFHCDFDLYLRTVWRFFNWYLEGQERKDKLLELLLRATFVFLYDLERQEILQPGQPVDDAIREGNFQVTIPEDKSMDRALSLRALGEYGSLERLVQLEVVQRAVAAAPKLSHSVRGVPLEEVTARYRECEPWRSDLVSLFRDLRVPRESKLKNLEQRFQQNWTSFYGGKVVDNISEEEVFLLPLGLQLQKQLLETEREKTASIPLRARIACILSLWHWDRTHARPAASSGD